jgi:uncharacterized spore protein YtfJ
MEKEEIRIEAPVTTAELILIPVVKDSLNYWSGKNRLAFIATREPLDLIIISKNEKRAFQMNGEEVSLEQLFGEVPGLKEKLEAL